jgi:hypothetical protein
MVAKDQKTNVGLFQSAIPADGTLAARSHARISASPASRAATQNLADFTGTLYPPIGGLARCRVSMVEVRLGVILVDLRAVHSTRCASCGQAIAYAVGGDVPQ